MDKELVIIIKKYLKSKWFNFTLRLWCLLDVCFSQEFVITTYRNGRIKSKTEIFSVKWKSLKEKIQSKNKT